MTPGQYWRDDLRAARYLGVAPWELADHVDWRERALLALRAEEAAGSAPMSQEPLAAVSCSCGRLVLCVAGLALAMEGDPCREAELPPECYEAIPAAELERATIGGKPAAGLPLEVVRLFRGERWNEAMLRWAAERINQAVEKASE